MNDRTEQWGPLDIEIRWKQDEWPELSWLGEYTNEEPESGLYVDRETGAVLWDGLGRLADGLPRMERRQMRYWVPGNDPLADEEAFKARDPSAYKGLEIVHGTYAAYAAGCVAQDYRRHEAYGNGWVSMGCTAEVEVAGAALAYASLWGIESDCDSGYAVEVAAELIEEIKRMAVDQVRVLRARLEDVAEFLEGERQPARE